MVYVLAIHYHLSFFIFFIFGTKGLLSFLKKAKLDGRTFGIRVCSSSPVVPHLFFTDDNVLFTQENEIACHAMMNLLSSYEEVLGQKNKNCKKCSLFWPSYATGCAMMDSIIVY